MGVTARSRRGKRFRCRLGIDPDLVDARPAVRSARPAHRDLRLLALVWAGGAIGTLIRYLVEEALPPSPAGWPWATFLINLTGSFALGFLLEFLARRGSRRRPAARRPPAVGTGVLGGYTTYSTFAVEITQLTTVTPYLVGPAYALAAWCSAPSPRLPGSCSRAAPVRRGSRAGAR